jgi:hypothetical protein
MVRIKNYSYGERNEIKWIKVRVGCILATLILYIFLNTLYTISSFLSTYINTEYT